MASTPCDADRVERFNEVIANLGDGNGQVQDFALTFLPQTPLANLLQPAPMVVSILGQLTVVAMAADFSLSEPVDGFKYIRHPNSFRATVSQLVDTGSLALQKSYSNFDMMHKRCATIKPSVNNIISLLAGEHAKSEQEMLQDIARFLPRELEGLDAAVSNCLSDAEATYEQFSGLQELVAEITQCCTASQGRADQELRDADILNRVLSEKKNALAESEKEYRTQKDISRAALENAQESFKNAVESQPGAFELLALQMTQDIGTGLMGGITSLVDRTLSLLEGHGKAAAAARSVKVVEQHPKKLDPSWQKAIELQTKVEILNGTAIGNDKEGVDWTRVSSDSRNGLVFLKGQLRADLAGIWPSTEVGVRVKTMYTRGLELASDLIGIAGPHPDPGKVQALVQDIKKYYVNVCELATEAALKVKSVPLADGGYVAAPTGGGSSSSVARMLLDRANFQIAVAQEQLNVARATAERQTEKLVDVTAELGNVLAEIAKVDMKKIDWEAIHKMLCKALLYLNQVKECIATLVLFFSEIRNIVSGSMRDACGKFIGYVKDATTADPSLGGVRLSAFTRQALYGYAVSAVKVSHFVQRVSAMYSQMYTDHVHDGVCQLLLMGRLLAQRDDVEAEAAVKNLQTWSLGAIKGIQNLVGAEQARIVSEIVGRQRHIETSLKGILPPPNPAMREAVAHAARAYLEAEAKEEDMEMRAPTTSGSTQWKKKPKKLD